jgi:UDP-2-acetamido-3-amino-2,3-dideoxy-glucuronate N-acetyltransferase
MERSNVLIHSTAQVSDGAVVGPGTRIWNQCQVRENVQIGCNCIFGKDVYIDFGVQIGDNVKIQNGAFVYHGTTIESGVFIGPGAIFTNDKLPRAVNPDGSLKSDSDWEVGETHVSYGASIGAGAVILPSVHIGRFAMVGAGAIVTRNVHDHALVVGNPARQIGFVCRCGAKLIRNIEGRYRCPSCNDTYDF